MDDIGGIVDEPDDDALRAVFGFCSFGAVGEVVVVVVVVLFGL